MKMFKLFSKFALIVSGLVLLGLFFVTKPEPVQAFNIDDLRSRIESLQQRVEQLQQRLTERQDECSSGYELSNGECKVKIPDSEKPGLVVVKQGVEGEDFARRIASARDWKFLAVTTSSPQQIRESIIEAYDEEKFHFLLIIGNDSQVPIGNTQLLEDFYSSSQDHEGWNNENVLDSVYYGNVDEDAFIELAAGRLPFSNQGSLKNYYLNLKSPKKIQSVNAFRPSARPGPLPMTLIRKSFLNFKVNKFITETLKIGETSSYLKKSDLFLFFSHGSKNSFSLSGDKDYSKADLPDLSKNRPIVISGACYTARGFGKEFVKKGGTAFVGYYFESQADRNPFPIRPLNKGDSIGKSTRDVINRNIAIHKWHSHAFLPSFYYLVGDPSLEIDYPETGNYSKLNFGKKEDELIIDIPPYQEDISYEVRDEGEKLLSIDGSGKAIGGLKMRNIALPLYNNITKGKYIMIEDSDWPSPHIFIKCSSDKKNKSYCNSVEGIVDDYDFLETGDIPYDYVNWTISTEGVGYFIFKLDKNYNIADFQMRIEGEQYSLSKYSTYKTISRQGEHFLLFNFAYNDFLDLIHSDKLFKEKKIVLGLEGEPTNQKPEASFTYTPSIPTTDDAIQFTSDVSDPDGTVNSYDWNFGDGENSTQQNPSHSYGSSGDYDVTLTVTDDDGATASTTTTIGVQEADCHTSDPWTWTYCSTDCKCEAGEGDCDKDEHCVTGHCARNVGEGYSQSSSMDVCEKKTTCEDSDGGKNYYEKGTVTQERKSRTDSCYGAFSVREYYCSDQEISSEVHVCEHEANCENGACQPGITVTSPNGEESWKLNETRGIIWESSNLDEEIKIVVIDEDSPIVTIAQTSNTGSYTWNIDETKVGTEGTIQPGGKYKIKICSLESDSVCDSSDDYFSIESETKGCTDSDGGKKYLQKGVTHGTRCIQGAATRNWEDYCSDSSTLTEYYCVDSYTVEGRAGNLCEGNVKSISRQCSGSCKDGVCIGGKKPPCGSYGDVNNDSYVTLKDKDILVEGLDNDTWKEWKVEKQSRADVNNDADLTEQDAKLIARYYSGLDDNFTVCKERRTSPCQNYGDVYDDGYVTAWDSYITTTGVASGDWSNPKIVKERVDVNDNGRIDFDDAAVINNYAQQEIDTFPVCSTSKLEGVKTQLASLESVLSDLSDVLKKVIQD